MMRGFRDGNWKYNLYKVEIQKFGIVGVEVIIKGKKVFLSLIQRFKFIVFDFYIFLVKWEDRCYYFFFE